MAGFSPQPDSASRSRVIQGRVLNIVIGFFDRQPREAMQTRYNRNHPMVTVVVKSNLHTARLLPGANSGKTTKQSSPRL